MSSFRQLMMKEKGGGGIPAQYTVIDYVNTLTYGTAYINTGIMPTSNTRVVTKIKNNGWSYQNTPVFGCFGASGSGGYYHLTPFNYKWYYGLDSGEGNGGSYSTQTTTAYEIDFNNNGKIIINGSTIATGIYTVGNGNLCIARRGGTTDSDIRYGFFKYYLFEVYESGVLVRNYVPVYDTVTQKFGFYETIQGVFKGNEGGGDFSGGND